LNLVDSILVFFALSLRVFAIALIAHVQRCLMVQDKIKFLAFFIGIPFSFFLLGDFISDCIKSNFESNSPLMIIGILGFLGARLLWKALRLKPEQLFFDYTNSKVLIGTSIIASIDFLILGLSLPFMKADRQIVLILLLIFTLIAVLLGLNIGKKLIKFELGNNLMLLGGILLLGIAIKLSILMLI
jgi:putative Mn2+ efflux pump MntP